MFRTSIETNKTNRTFSKQTKTNRKNLQKTLSIRVSSKQLLFFSPDRNKPNSICFGCFSVCFFGKPPKKFGGLFRCFGPLPKQTEQVRGVKKVYILTICCCFGWSLVCFGCFETPKFLVSILKRNNQNKRLVSDCAETSFSSKFRLFRYETSFGGHPILTRGKSKRMIPAGQHKLLLYGI